MSPSLSLLACVGLRAPLLPPSRAECIYKYVYLPPPPPLLRVNCCLVYYALQIMHYLSLAELRGVGELGSWVGGVARGGTLGRSGDCIKINLTESICLIAN